MQPGSNTCHMIFVYILNERLNGVYRQDIENRLNLYEPQRNKKNLEEIYDKYDYDIEKIVQNVCYMNLQKWINEEQSSKFDKKREDI
jgi:hypothetical protein